jgi:hypothetical protein
VAAAVPLQPAARAPVSVLAQVAPVGLEPGCPSCSPWRGAVEAAGGLPSALASPLVGVTGLRTTGDRVAAAALVEAWSVKTARGARFLAPPPPPP